MSSPLLTGVSATSLITLAARAAESQLKDSLLRDTFAIEAARKIPIDLTPYQIPRDGQICLAIRARTLDDWTREFLQSHPDCTVVHLGCGLDSRVYRIAPPEGVKWFNIDFPEVIAVRRQIYPARPGEHSIESSVFAENWLEEIPNDKPTFIVAEGVFPYIRREDLRDLVNRLLGRFSQGELCFDGYRQWGVWFLNNHRSIRSTGAQLRWGLKSSRELEEWNDRLQLLTARSEHDPKQVARLTLPLRILNRLPYLNRFAVLLRYRFQ